MTTKIERLINLIAILSDTMRPLTQAEIVSTVPGYNSEVKASSRRTFERDKDELRKLGFDIAQTPTPSGDYGYRINKDNTYYSVSLTPAQRNIVQCALAMYSPSEDASLKSLTKLGGANPENELENVISLSIPDNVDKLFDYCSKSASISFSYRDEIRRVHTKKLIAKSGYWYLECLDLDKNEIRNFRVDRLSDIKQIESHIDLTEIVINNDDDELVENEIKVIVSVHEELKKKFSKDWNAKENSEGNLEFKIPRLEIFEIRYFDYVGFVKVLEPDELKESIDRIFNIALSTLEGAK